MKIKQSRLLKLEHTVIREFKTKINPSVPPVPIEENLSLSYSILQSKEDESSIAINMKAKTIKQTQLQFFIEAMFIFKILESELLGEKKNQVIPTMVSISYSTLRGILLRELPLVDLSNRILPVVDLPVLMRALEKKKKSSSKSPQ